MQSKINSILKTLIYSDIFEFPLNSSEIHKYFYGRKIISKEDIEYYLLILQKRGEIGFKKGYYYLSNRKNLVAIRNERTKEGKRKLKIAKKALKFLTLIPTIKLIGISGSLSVLNSKRTDDIDLFFITSKNTVWVTRFFVNLTLLLTSKKRSVGDSLSMDKICPNMYLSEDSLQFNKNRQNLFSAREITQLRVLYNRNESYQKFLNKNSWINNFLANIKIPKKTFNTEKPTNRLITFINYIFFTFQFLYMSRKITYEEIKPQVARFHPSDKTDFVLDLFKKRSRSTLKSKNTGFSLKNYSRILTYSN